MAKRADKSGAPPEPKKMGRPPFEWTEEIEDAIMDEIMSGRSFREFMVGENRDHRFPSVPTFFKKLRDDDDFAKRYVRAREFQADIEFEEMKEIADNSSNDWMENHDPDNPGYRLNGDHVQRSKLRIDVRKFRVTKMNRNYSEYLQDSKPQEELAKTLADIASRLPE